MKNSRLGFLTPPGLIAAGLTIVIITVITLLKGGVVFSPGALNAQPGQSLGGYASHAEFGGQCKLCHAPFWDPAGMDARCTACHVDIAVQLADPATLHGAIIQRNPSLVCRDCHPDHRGVAAPLTDFQDAHFPHELLGYSLSGHALTSGGLPFICADCHGTDLTTFDPAICQSCHQQEDAAFIAGHILAFGTDCLVCHDGIDTFGSLFDHNLFPFQLAGQHAGAPCLACHVDARTIPDLRSAPTGCIACHADDDIHLGSLGADCGDCHAAAGWIPAIFDHDQAAFRLLGKHAAVPCEACHTDRIFTNTPTDCFSCHASDDIHLGRFGTDCAACHEVAGWIPALFDHNLSAFKLTGAHVTAACESCHVNHVYLGTPTDCYSCHASDDEHAGRYGTSCGSCHTTSAWLPAFFDHNLSSFKLTGAHAGLACASCHSSGVYAGLASACAACHADPPFHAGLFGGMSCDQCHGTSSWTPASFNLSHPGGCDGNCASHEGASCRDCHTSTLASATCLQCHDSNNPDGGGGDD